MDEIINEAFRHLLVMQSELSRLISNLMARHFLHDCQRSVQDYFLGGPFP
jgi:hypothetical protein